MEGFILDRVITSLIGQSSPDEAGVMIKIVMEDGVVNVGRIVLRRDDTSPKMGQCVSYDPRAYVDMFDKQGIQFVAGNPFDKSHYLRTKADILIFVEGWEPDARIAIEYILTDAKTNEPTRVDKKTWFA